MYLLLCYFIKVTIVPYFLYDKNHLGFMPPFIKNPLHLGEALGYFEVTNFSYFYNTSAPLKKGKPKLARNTNYF